MNEQKAKEKLVALLRKRIDDGLCEFDAVDIADAIEAMIDERIGKTLETMIAVRQKIEQAINH